MKLKDKLFFSAGSLFLILGILLTLSFLLLLKGHLPAIKEKIGTLFTEQRVHEESQELLLFKEHLDEEKEQLDTLFFALHPEVHAQTNPWSFLAQTLVTHPNIGFAQLHRGDDVFTIVPSQAPFHPISTFAMNDRFFFVIVAKNGVEKVEEDHLYLAYPISASYYGAFPTYLLFSWKENRNAMKDFLGSFADKPPISLPTLSSGLENEREKLKLLNTLASYYEEGLEIFPEKPKVIPQGIALFSGEGVGKALLSSELFHKEPFFDDIAYYEKQGSKSSFATVGEGTAVITSVTSQLSGEVYIGNVSRFEKGFLTLGIPLSPLLRKFAVTTHQNVLLVTSNKVALGFTPTGEKMNAEMRENANSLNSSLSANLSLLAHDELTMQVWPTRSFEKAFFSTLDQQNQQLLRKLLGKSLLILVPLIILALLAWRYLVKRFTDSLMHLVHFVSTMKLGKLKVIDPPQVSNKDEEVSQLTSGMQEMLAEVREKDRIRSLLNRVVSKEIAEEILKTDPHLGGEDRVITILFADIRNFTELSAHLPPQKTVGILNSIMTIVSRIIEGEGGVIDKYVGDEVMALFGAPVVHPDHALRALSTAKLIVETLRNWNQERVSRGEQAIEIGIGINTGLAVAGNMGAEDRLNYTVVGPSVNLASRLCKAAQPMQIIISEFTLEEPAIKDSFYVESLPDVTLKGFSEPVRVFQVTGFKWEST